MASKDLIEYVDGVEKIISQQGISYECAEALSQAAQVAITSENDIQYGLEVSEKAKKYIENLILDTTGMNVFEVDKYCQENKTSVNEIDLWWKILKIEAPYLLDSYLLFLEKNREWKDRFYQHRRRCFLKIGVIQALQDLEDDKIDILAFSIIPGGG